MKKTQSLLPKLLALLLLPLSLSADTIQVGPGFFSSGIPSDQFEFFVAKQSEPHWCWAACVQMTLNFHGLPVSQNMVVQRIVGQQVDVGGSPNMVLAALSGWAPNNQGGFSAIQASPYVMGGLQLVNDLASRRPLIVGLNGQQSMDGQQSQHAYVMTAVFYTVNPFNGEPIFQKVVLRDPWPYSPSRVELSWQEFQARMFFIARVGVTKLY